jgi:hypothetical protein
LGRFAAITRADRAPRLAAALACTLLLGGCGGIEFQGKVFDYMGLSGDRKQADVRMNARAPLMVPPNLQALPAPGPGSAVATARQDWPDDPERVQKRVVAAKKAKESEAEAKADPINPYAGKPTLLDKLFKRSKTEEAPLADVPEPDPSDRIQEEGAVAARPAPLTPHVPHAPLPATAVQPATPDSYSRATEGGVPAGY